MNLRPWFRRKREFEEGMGEELRFHLEQQVAANLAAGMTPAEAQRQARLQLGAIEGLKEDCRDERSGAWLETLWADARYGLRMLWRNPGFTVVAILTLALGIGATSAVFSIVDRILFRAMPYPQAQRLVSFGYIAPFEPQEFLGAMDYLEWRKDTSAFAETTSMVPGAEDCDLTEQNPLRVNCAKVESTFLSTLGIQPLLGRNFTREEDRPHAPPVALLSYGLWRSRYGGDPTIVGRSISLDGQSTQIVGVLPAGFEMPTLSPADLLTPQALDEAGLRRSGPQPILRCFARLRSGVTVEQARASLEPLFAQSILLAPPTLQREVTLSLRSLRDRQMHDSVASSWILFGSVLAVLLLACSNVASLLLARTAGRRSEIAVRAALGASAARLIRQALTEALLLSLLGGAAGCFVAYGLLRVFVSIAPEGVPHLQQAAIDSRVLLFALGIALASGISFGLAPAWRSPEPHALSGRAIQPTAGGIAREILVTAQIALSLILLACAGLLMRSLWNLQDVPLGMNVQNVITAQITLGHYRYPEKEQQRVFFEQLETKLRRVPGVESVALTNSLPPLDRGNATVFSSMEVEGRLHTTEGRGGMVGYSWVTPRYFAALGVPILEGRSFNDRDLVPGETSVILSKALASKLFGDENPIGRSMKFAGGPWHLIVGVAADVKNNGLQARPDPGFYLPWKDDPDEYSDRAHVIIHTPVRPDTMAKWLRAEVASLDPTQPLTIETMQQRVSKLADRPRFNALLLSIFALMALALAAIGIYGVVSFLVARRTREIGVRMALGARPGGIFRLILGSVARWTTAGVLVGLAGGWFATRLLRSLLFQVPVHDPWLFFFAVAAVFAVALSAAWIPARRAMRVDPIVALRYE